MESNRDESDKCIELGIQYMNADNFEKAQKFFNKAVQLYPTQKTKELLDKLKQHKVVNKIMKMKNFYQILGVRKKSSDSEIEKAYKKLALQLHPDKNKAPGAEDAFKKLLNAYETLKDGRKRKRYDMEIAVEQENIRFNNTNNGHSDSGYQESNAHQQQEPTLSQPFLAIGLGLLILGSMLTVAAFFPSNKKPDPIYNLQSTAKYSIKRRTRTNKVPYYVKENFVSEYQGTLSSLENSVEEEYFSK